MTSSCRIGTVVGNQFGVQHLEIHLCAHAYDSIGQTCAPSTKYADKISNNNKPRNNHWNRWHHHSGATMIIVMMVTGSQSHPPPWFPEAPWHGTPEAGVASPRSPCAAGGSLLPRLRSSATSGEAAGQPSKGKGKTRETICLKHWMHLNAKNLQVLSLCIHPPILWLYPARWDSATAAPAQRIFVNWVTRGNVANPTRNISRNFTRNGWYNSATLSMAKAWNHKTTQSCRTKARSHWRVRHPGPPSARLLGTKRPWCGTEKTGEKRWIRSDEGELWYEKGKPNNKPSPLGVAPVGMM